MLIWLELKLFPLLIPFICVFLVYFHFIWLNFDPNLCYSVHVWVFVDSYGASMAFGMRKSQWYVWWDCKEDRENHWKGCLVMLYLQKFDLWRECVWIYTFIVSGPWRMMLFARVVCCNGIFHSTFWTWTNPFRLRWWYLFYQPMTCG